MPPSSATAPPVTSSPLPTLQTAGVSATFSEYANLSQPVYYDLPGTTYDDDPQVSAIHFSNAQSSSIRLVLSISLFSGLKMVTARALVDPGSEGDFLDPSFAASHGLGLFVRPFPLQCNGFDGAPSVHGPITHFWDGRMVMHGDDSAVFESPLNLNVTPLGGFDVILGMPWLRSHNGWVGGAGPSLRLEDSSGVELGRPGNVSSVSAAPVDLSFLPEEFHEFADVFNPQNTTCLPPVRPGYDLEINLKTDSLPPTSNSYLLSQDETEELRVYLEVQLAKGFIRKSSSPICSPMFFVKSEGKANRPCVDYRRLNAVTVRDNYPLPLLGQLLQQLRGCKFFAKLDLKTAFNLL